jgi:hypothetical protein
MDKLKKNIDLLWETNETPLHILLPVCRLVTNPEQLGSIEKSSPHVRGHLGDMWLKLIKRNIGGWERMFTTKKHKDGTPWTEDEVKHKITYATYQRCLAQMEAQELQAEETLREATSKAKAHQRNNETKFVDSLPPGYLKGKPRQRYDGTSRSSAATGELRFTGGSKTKTTTAKGFMNRVRREVKEQKFMKAGGSLSTPSHLLQEKAKFMPKGEDVRATGPRKPGGAKVIRHLVGKPLSTIIHGSAPPRRPREEAASPARKSPPRIVGPKMMAAAAAPAKAKAPTPLRQQQSSSSSSLLRKRTPDDAGLDNSDQAASPPPPPSTYAPTNITMQRPVKRRKPPPTVLLPPRRK